MNVMGTVIMISRFFLNGRHSDFWFIKFSAGFFVYVLDKGM